MKCVVARGQMRKRKSKTKRALSSRGVKRSLDARRAEVSSFEGKSVRIFFYGTMKRNFYNYNAYLSCACSRGQARFLHDAVTEDPYRLVLWGERHVPAMVDHNDTARSMSEEHPLPHVHGEVFLVDKHTLAALDDFYEDGEVRYIRKSIRVIKSMSASHIGHGRKANAYVYLVSPTAELATLPTLAEYTEKEHAAYSNPMFQPKVFELMTGVDKEYFSSLLGSKDPPRISL